MSAIESLIATLIDVAHRVAERGLVVATSGNASVRLPGGRFAVSGSGTRLDSLLRDDVAICSIDDESRHEGARPSLETPFHRAAYRVRDDVGAVLHMQAPYATALCCAEDIDLALDFIPEVPAYLGTPAVIDYHDPGSDALSAAVGAAAANAACRVLMLRSHGQIVLGTDADSALRNAEFLELACRIRCQGLALRTYDDDTVRRLRRYGDPT